MPDSTNGNTNQLETYLRYGRGPQLLPEVPSVGFGIYRRAAIGGPRPYAIGIVYEICYINRGSVEWWVDNKLYEVGPGSVFINRPGEWYGGNKAMYHPCEVYWVQIEFLENGTLPTLTQQATERLHQDFANMAARFFPASPDLKNHYDNLLAEYRHLQAYSSMAARAALHQILVCTLRDYARQQSRTPSPGIEDAIRWIERHLTEDYPIEDLAYRANMSTGYFYKKFQEEVGFTPGEYRMRRRIHLAKYLLRDQQMSITDIAFMLGFSTSQYFATVFKKLSGLSPGEYRQIVFG
jgi:AraC family L-rhamnose operon regulatory protein RhaS